MSLISKLFKKAPTLPDDCSEQVVRAIEETIKWATAWGEKVHISVTPSDAQGNTTYSKQTGLRVGWWERSLTDCNRIYTNDYMHHFNRIVNKFGEEEMVFYHPLPSESIGQEAAYISHIVEKLQSDFPNASISIGSHGRQLSISTPKIRRTK